MATQSKKKNKAPFPKGIRQRESGRFIVDVTVNGVRRTATVTTINEAIKKRAELLFTGRTPSSTTTKPQPTGWTLKETYERTLTTCWIGTHSEKTHRINGTAVLDFFGEDMPIVNITTDQIDRFVASLIALSNSDATINRKLSALSKMLRIAYDREQLTALPKIPRRTEKEGRIRFLTVKEEEELLNWFRQIGKHDHLEAIIILLDTGFRTSELWRVESQHVDMQQGVITLWRTKNGKPRTIPMTQRVFAIIKQRCQQYTIGALFPKANNMWLRSQWDRVRLLMGKDQDAEFVPHMLRHTCCSRLVQRGVPLIHVQSWMGHKDIQTTMRYAHLAPRDLFSAAAVLEGGETARWQNQSSGDATTTSKDQALVQ